MKTLVLSLTLALISGALFTPHTFAQDVRLRPIDRATVRIIAVRGAEPRLARGRSSGAARVIGAPHTSHGSGVAVAPRLIATAAHVVTGATHWAVVVPGSNAAVPAYPRYIHPTLDLAFVEVENALPHHVALRPGRTLSLSETVSASGYPLDVRESTPAAVTGQLARVGRDGMLHLAMSVNPGNSGGPVIDGRGHIIGILSARGRPDQGVEGLAIAVPLRPILESRRQMQRVRRHRFTEADRNVADAVPLIMRLEAEQTLSTTAPQVTALLDRTIARARPAPEADAIVATLGWNTLLAILENDTSPSVEVPPGHLTSMRDVIIRLARRALNTGPHTRRHFPMLRPIVGGRVNPFPNHQADPNSEQRIYW